MRFWLICAFGLAACGSAPRESAPSPGSAVQQTRVIFRQYYGNSHIFVIENAAGRDIVKLRSKPAKAGSSPVAYIPDEVMAKVLAEFERLGFYRHAGPRPADPLKVGGRAELTVIDPNQRATSLIRRHGQDRSAHDAYTRCVQTFLVVHDNFGRFMATSSTEEAFGVRKAEFRGTR